MSEVFFETFQAFQNFLTTSNFGFPNYMIGVAYLCAGLMTMVIFEGITIFKSFSPLVIGIFAWPMYLVGATLALVGKTISKTFSLFRKIWK